MLHVRDQRGGQKTEQMVKSELKGGQAYLYSNTEVDFRSPWKQD